MSYTLKKAGSLLDIAEKQYGVGTLIKFTKFTSCIGILAQIKPDSMIAIHLDMTDDGNKSMTGAVTASVKAELQKWKYIQSTLMIIGQITYWTASKGNLYKELRALGPSYDCEFQMNDGVYGASLKAGKIELAYY